jgi:hypothetical protein
MQWSGSGRVWRATRGVSRLAVLLAAIGAMALAACDLTDHPGTMAGQPRGATVAFESIDGLPPGQFHTLVQALNDEAQTRRLAVLSRENPSAYRVRGYLAAKIVKRETTISWVWDVFDRDDRRALRIAGEETAKGRHHDAWSAADDQMLHRIARSSMDKLAAFLTSPGVAPGTPDSEPRMALAGTSDSSPEAAGIFRIFQPKADPAPVDTAEAPAATEPVPLPPRRPSLATAVSAGQRLTLAASSH